MGLVGEAGLRRKVLVVRVCAVCGNHERSRAAPTRGGRQLQLEMATAGLALQAAVGTRVTEVDGIAIASKQAKSYSNDGGNMDTVNPRQGSTTMNSDTTT